MNILEQILNYFPPIDNYNKDLIDEYYTAYKIKISPYKNEFNYPIEYFDKLHYLRYKLYNDFDYSLLYLFNSFPIKHYLKNELISLIDQLKIQQEQQEQQKLIQMADEYNQNKMEEDLKSISLQINPNELFKKFEDLTFTTKFSYNKNKIKKKHNKNNKK